jgi:hypothetical protein
MFYVALDASVDAWGTSAVRMSSFGTEFAFTLRIIDSGLYDVEAQKLRLFWAVFRDNGHCWNAVVAFLPK